MEQVTKTKKELAQYLKEALQPFCAEKDSFRKVLTSPFRQTDSNGEDCVMASDAHGLICVRAKKAGIAVGPFCKMDDIAAYKVIPDLGSNRCPSATVRRSDMAALLDQMQLHERDHKQMAVAYVRGVNLAIEGLSYLEQAMAIFGAEQARLVWSEDQKVMLELDNERGQASVVILYMGCAPLDPRVFVMPFHYGEDADVQLSWQRGMQAWPDIKAELEFQEEAERMAHREVYMVEVVKRCCIPVYAKDADEARSLCDSRFFFPPEDEYDVEWSLGDTVPEVEYLDDIDDCYENIITRDGVVERDKIYELDRISKEWNAKRKDKGE